MTSSDSGKVRVLPPELASQIAAGEVVERPASVVKELVENALDAGASRIAVSVVNGGIDLIRVSDDGSGMIAQDAVTAFQPHATSKVREVEDLDAITTLGFRGEALPSIASVSKIRLVTRVEDEPSGTQVEIEGTAPMRVREVGTAPGTVVEVADLFFNVPARRKFLKKPSTEASHCQETLVRLAMVHPDVHFLYEQDGRVLLDLARHRDLEERIRELLGRKVRQGLYFAEQERGQTRVRLLAAGPAEAVRSARSCYFFVNGRFVRDRILLKSLTGGFGPVLGQGQYPVAVVLVELPAELVDVNVHPQKFEVRFRREREVAAALRGVTASLVAEAPWSEVPGASMLATVPNGAPSERHWGEVARRVDGGLSRSPGSESFSARGAPRSSGFESGRGRSDYFRTLERETRPLPSGAGRAAGPTGVSIPEDADRRGPARDARVLQQSLTGARGGAQSRLGGESAREPQVGRRGLTSLRYVGQVMGTYLLFEAEGELVVMDQHAAHERVNYNRIMATLEDRSLVSQRLLLPRTVNLEAAEAEALVENQETLRRFGFEIEPFGSGALALKAVPAVVVEAGGDPEALVGEVASVFSNPAEESNPEALLSEMAATLACHASIRAGHRMEEREVRALLEALEQPGPWDHCPHGRPILFRMSRAELERRFHRS